MKAMYGLNLPWWMIFFLLALGPMAGFVVLFAVCAVAVLCGR